MTIVVYVVRAEEVLDEVHNFYKTHESAAIIGPNDMLVIAKDKAKICGCVRLCQEEENFTLRSMLVREDYRHLGIGKQILLRFESLINELHVPSSYCIPYSHLENFYGMIGFRKIIEETAPIFLQNRIASYRTKRPDSSFIIMNRS